MRAGYWLLSAVLLAFAAGCASTPISTTLPDIAEHPERFRNKYVEITARVIDNPPPRGDDYRTWSFTLDGTGDRHIVASEEGFNPSTIDKAYYLVEKARKAGEPVSVTGKLRVGPHNELGAGMQIELVGVRYGGTEIRTDKGPFVNRYYYGPPVFFHFGYFYHHGHHRHHRHYH